MKVDAIEKTIKHVNGYLNTGPQQGRKRVGVGRSLTNFLFKDLNKLKKENNLLTEKLLFQTNTVIKTQSLSQNVILTKMEENVSVKKDIIQVRHILLIYSSKASFSTSCLINHINRLSYLVCVIAVQLVNQSTLYLIPKGQV